MATNLLALQTPTRLLCLALILGLSVGCSDRLPTYPVTGRVQFKTGGAVHTGTVELKSREHGIHARGAIQNDGTFTLGTYEADDGAVAGLHDCVIVQLVMTEDVSGHRPSTIGVIDRRYGGYSSSGLQVEVVSGNENHVLLEVDGILKQQPQDHKH